MMLSENEQLIEKRQWETAACKDGEVLIECSHAYYDNKDEGCGPYVNDSSYYLVASKGGGSFRANKYCRKSSTEIDNNKSKIPIVLFVFVLVGAGVLLTVRVLRKKNSS